MIHDGKIRPWREIAQELQAEHDPQRAVELARELAAALDQQNSNASPHNQKQPPRPETQSC